MTVLNTTYIPPQAGTPFEVWVLFIAISVLFLFASIIYKDQIKGAFTGLIATVFAIVSSLGVFGLYTVEIVKVPLYAYVNNSSNDTVIQTMADLSTTPVVHQMTTPWMGPIFAVLVFLCLLATAYHVLSVPEDDDNDNVIETPDIPKIVRMR